MRSLVVFFNEYAKFDKELEFRTVGELAVAFPQKLFLYPIREKENLPTVFVAFAIILFVRDAYNTVASRNNGASIA